MVEHSEFGQNLCCLRWCPLGQPSRILDSHRCTCSRIAVPSETYVPKISARWNLRTINKVQSSQAPRGHALAQRLLNAKILTHGKSDIWTKRIGIMNRSGQNSLLNLRQIDDSRIKMTYERGSSKTKKRIQMMRSYPKTKSPAGVTFVIPGGALANLSSHMESGSICSN